MINILNAITRYYWLSELFQVHAGVMALIVILHPSASPLSAAATALRFVYEFDRIIKHLHFTSST